MIAWWFLSTHQSEKLHCHTCASHATRLRDHGRMQTSNHLYWEEPIQVTPDITSDSPAAVLLQLTSLTTHGFYLTTHTTLS